MATAAERQRRYRRHSKGDHSLCDPARCRPPSDPPAPATERDPEGPRSARFGPRGSEVWSGMVEAGLGPAHRVLLEEACRIADRLDRLDAMLDGREHWIRLQSRDEDGTTFVVVIDALLAEARQQASTLRGLVGELRQALPPPKKGSGRLAEPSPVKGAGVADLAARAARRRASAG